LLFIKQRAIVLGLTVPAILKRAINSKPWDGLIFDTMVEFAGFGNFVSMDNLCYYLSIETPKQEVKGENYGDFWRSKKFEECQKYGIDEIVALREVYSRLK